MEDSKVEKLKQLINFSPIFEINEKESAQLYIKERDILATQLFHLYGKLAMEYDEELLVSLLESLKYYDKSRGDFLVLFDVVFKQKINKTKRVEQYKGVKISQQVYAKAKFIYSKLRSSGKTLKDFTINDIDEICEKTLSQKVKKTLMEAIMLLYNGKNFVPIKTTQNEDEEGISEEVLKSNDEDIGLNLENNEALNSLLTMIENVYRNDVRADTKKMFNIYITRILIESDISVGLFKNREYFDEWTYEFFITNKVLPKNIDIAKHEERAEEKISSLFKNFANKLSGLKKS